MGIFADRKSIPNEAGLAFDGRGLRQILGAYFTGGHSIESNARRQSEPRYSGKLKKWNAERGFGFIVADDGGQDIFVHISAFARSATVPPDFKCDGRNMCSQMTSCREASLFLQNCPGMQMDGNGDGVPCEQQWCTK